MFFVLVVSLIVFLIAFWQPGSSSIEKNNEHLKSEIKKVEEEYRDKQGSWERAIKSEGRKLKPYYEKKREIEKRITEKLDDWMDSTDNKTNT